MSKISRTLFRDWLIQRRGKAVGTAINYAGIGDRIRERYPGGCTRSQWNQLAQDLPQSTSLAAAMRAWQAFALENGVSYGTEAADVEIVWSTHHMTTWNILRVMGHEDPEALRVLTWRELGDWTKLPYDRVDVPQGSMDLFKKAFETLLNSIRAQGAGSSYIFTRFPGGLGPETCFPIPPEVR